MEDSIKLSIIIKADPYIVWKTLTESAYIEKYLFGCHVDSLWVPDSEINFYQTTDVNQKPVVIGRIIEIELNKKLKHSLFPTNAGYSNSQDNRINVTYILKNIGGSTDLTIIHEGYSIAEEGEKRYLDTIKGWDHALPLLKKVAESIEL